jgi:hypothetical protein
MAKFSNKRQIVDTMKDASKTPKTKSQKASLGLILNSVLATAPVQAPVTGKGIPTKTTNPNFPHLAYVFEKAFSVLLKNQSNIFFVKFHFEKNFTMKFRKYKIGSNGNIFPKTERPILS